MAAVSYTREDFLDKIGSNGNMSISHNYRKRVREADTGVQDLIKEMQSFRKSVRNLHNYDSKSFDKNMVKRRLDTFAKSYNSFTKSSDAAENEEIQKETDKLNKILNDNAKSLKKLGIKMKNGKMSFDEDAFKKLEDKEIKKLCDSLFEGSDSFIAKVNKTMRQMDTTAEDEEYNVVTRNFHSLSYNSMETKAAYASKMIKESLAVCTEIANRIEKGETVEEEEINKSILDYRDYYDNLYRSGCDVEAVRNMQSLTLSKESDLGVLGITTIEGKVINYNQYVTKDDTFHKAYALLFKSDSDYVTKMNGMNGMNGYCDDTINTVLNTVADKLGIAFDVSG